MSACDGHKVRRSTRRATYAGNVRGQAKKGAIKQGDILIQKVTTLDMALELQPDLVSKGATSKEQDGSLGQLTLPTLALFG
jgi:hypothetical protein